MNNPIVTALSIILTESGFIKKSDTWYRYLDETIMVINLQKSQYGKQYYLNLGIYLKQLGSALYPKEHHCHIRIRLTSLIPEAERPLIQKIFDLENHDLTEKERSDNIIEVFKKYCLPFVDSCSTILRIKETYQNNKLSNAMVHRNVKELISNISMLDE